MEGEGTTEGGGEGLEGVDTLDVTDVGDDDAGEGAAEGGEEARAANPDAKPGEDANPKEDAIDWEREIDVPIKGGGTRKVKQRELVENYELRRESYARMEQANKAVKGVQNLVGELKDPARLGTVLQKLGHDPVALAEAWLRDALEEAELPETEREKRAIAKEREKLAKEREEWESKRRQTEEQRAAAEHYATLEKSWTEEISKRGITGKRAGTLIVEMAKLAETALEVRGELPSPAHLLEAVLEGSDPQPSTPDLGSMSVDDLVKLLGPEKVEALRKAKAAETVAQVASKRPKSTAKPGAAPPKPGQQRPKKIPSWALDDPAKYFLGD